MADPKEQSIKQQRLATALRENLKRRKAQARAKDSRSAADERQDGNGEGDRTTDG